MFERVDGDLARRIENETEKQTLQEQNLSLRGT
jgi:hypothetical protein